jgi:protein-S-isoprenylcysteine O-methyltransferase Ste14
MKNGYGGRNLTVRVRPGKAGAIALIVVPVLFLMFGVVLFSSVMDGAGEARKPIIMFGVIWCVVMVMLAGYSIYNIVNPKGVPGLEIDITESDDSRPGDGPRHR